MGLRYSFFKNNFSQLLAFFIIQTISAFSLLVFYLLGWDFAFTMALLLKLSIFPFHFWYLNLVSFFPNIILFISSTFYKIPSILILYNFFGYINYSLISFSILLTIAVGALVIIYTNDLRFLLIRSSVSNNSWFVLSVITELLFFILYIIIYSLFLYLIIDIIGTSSSGYLTRTSAQSLFLILICLVSMAGMPPFPVFYIKMFIVIFIISFFHFNIFIFFLMLLRVLMLLGYLKFCFRILISSYRNSHMFIILV